MEEKWWLELMEQCNDSYSKDLSMLYGKVGLIVNLSQMIEYTLANIFAFNDLLKEFEEKDTMLALEYNEYVVRANNWYKKLNSKTLGYVIKEAKQVNLFKEDLLKNKYLETNPKFYFDRLEKLITDMDEINNILNEIFKLQKEKYNLIW